MTRNPRRAPARITLAALAFALTFPLACGSSRGDAAARPRAVVLVTVGGLRGDVVGFTGRPGPTPHLDALARAARVFPRAYVATPDPAASLHALLSGRFPLEGATAGPPPPAATLAERFRAAGFVTAGAALGADDLASARAELGLDAWRSFPMAERGAALEHLSAAGRRQGRGAFLWLHVALDPPGGDASVAPRAYEDALRALDGLVRDAKAALALDRPDLLLVVAGTHGQELLERGGTGRGSSLFDEQVRVPLLIRWIEGLGERGRIEPALASLVDLHPTLLELAGIGAGPGTDGRSLAACLRGAAPPRERLFVTLPPASLACVREGAFKLVADLRPGGPVRLFHVASDPRELVDMSGERPKVRARLEQALRDVVDGAGGAP